MTDVINTREIVLAVLNEVLEEDKYSHIVLREVLEKYQYLEKRDRSFITRVVEGTLENLIEMDYIISQFSSVKVSRMKPAIRNILRMSVYQLKYMDSVPDSAVCNEGVKLAQRKGFQSERFRERCLKKCGKKSGQGKISGSEGDAGALSFRHLFHAGMDSQQLAPPL